MTTDARAAFCAILAIGLALRLLGIGWGLPDPVRPGALPYHPDEHVAYEEAFWLYRDARPVSFTWGGALYMRVARGARAAARSLASEPTSSEFALALLLLRLLNVAAALVTAGLTAWIAWPLGGERAALLAAALLLFFPNHVLASHFARPDVLMTCFSAAALACACAVAHTGRWALLLLGGCFAGLATATMLSGAIAFPPLVVAWWEARRGRAGVARGLATAALGAAVAGLAGFASGSFESFQNWEAFRAGLRLAQRVHNDGGFSFPVRLLTASPLYAFGSVGAISGFAGFAWLLRRRVTGWATLVCYLATGILLLGRVGGDLMRHLLFLAPALAATAAAGLVAAGRWAGDRPGGRRAPALAIPLAAAVWTLQLSLAYVLPMQFGVDARIRTGRWLVEHAPQGTRVGLTRSFLGDRTFVPRLPARHGLRLVSLNVRPGADVAARLDPSIGYVVTTDVAAGTAAGPDAERFFRDLLAGDRYRRVAEIGPPWSPLCVPRWLGIRPPADLGYTRATFYVFRRSR